MCSDQSTCTTCFQTTVESREQGEVYKSQSAIYSVVPGEQRYLNMAHLFLIIVTCELPEWSWSLFICGHKTKWARWQIKGKKQHKFLSHRLYFSFFLLLTSGLCFIDHVCLCFGVFFFLWDHLDQIILQLSFNIFQALTRRGKIVCIRKARVMIFHVICLLVCPFLYRTASRFIQLIKNRVVWSFVLVWYGWYVLFCLNVLETDNTVQETKFCIIKEWSRLNAR